MRIKRPLAWMGFSASAALLFVGLTGWIAAFVLLGIALVGVTLCLVLYRKHRLQAGLLVCLSLLLATASFLWQDGRLYRPQEEYADQTLPLSLTLTEERAVYTNTTLYTASVQEGDLPADTNLFVWVPHTVEADLLDTVSGVVTFYPLEDTVFTNQNKADGIVLTGQLDGWNYPVTVTKAANTAASALQSIRQSAVDVVESYLTGEQAAIVRSLSLGDRSRLSAETDTAFRRSGVSHLLVVSGLHLSMVGTAVMGLLRLLRMKRRPAALLAIVAVVAFMLLVGFTPSVKRAGTMFLVMLLGILCKREADGLNSLGLALLLIGLADPYMVFDVGLQLSVASVTGILLFYPRIEHRWLQPYIRDNRRRLVRWLYLPAQAVSLSLSAMTLVTPLLGLYFGELSIVFIPANLLMVFPSTVAVVAGLLGVLFGGWCPPLGRPAFFVAGLIAKYLTAVADWFSGFSFATLSIDYLYIGVWGVLCALVGVWFWRNRTRFQRLLAVMTALLILMSGTLAYQYVHRDLTTCTLIRSESGTASLMAWEGNTLLAVSGGDDALLRRAVTYMKNQRIDRLSALVLLDLDDAALSGLPWLYTSCEIGHIFTPESGRYLPAVTDLFDENHRTTATDTTFCIGEHTFRLREGWLSAHTGETRWLFASAYPSLPPEEETDVDGLVYAHHAVHTERVSSELSIAGGWPPIEDDAERLLLPSFEEVSLFTREDGRVYCE